MKTNCIINRYICEYDIRKANISVLYDSGIISRDLYLELYSADRMVRQVHIGKLQRKDSSVTEALRSGIKNARDKFTELNNIKSDNIIRISNDALYLVDVDIKHTKISEHVEFIKKSEFSSYMSLGHGIEIFYKYDQFSDKEYYKILGLRNTANHEKYFIQLILAVFNILETETAIDALKYLNEVIELYVNKDLSLEYYREFNTQGYYNMNGYQLNHISEFDKINALKRVNISYNYSLLLDIHSIITSYIFD